MKKLAAWFDIPVSDMARAIAFYEHVTSQKLKRMPVGEDRETALFEADGCLFLAPEDKPSHYGSRVYFAADSGIDDCLLRVKAAGGKTLVEKTSIGFGEDFFVLTLKTAKATALVYYTVRCDSHGQPCPSHRRSPHAIGVLGVSGPSKGMTMSHKEKSQLNIIFTAPPDPVAEGDRIFASHAKWLRNTHAREGEKALLLYNLVKGPELSNPMDPSSAPTGNTSFVLTEVYDTPAGVAEHWKADCVLGRVPLGRGCGLSKVKVTTVHGAPVVHSLW